MDALEFIRRANPSTAVRFRQRVKRGLRRLEQYPDSGRRLPEFPDLPHCEVIVRPYRFFYRVRGQTVWVVAVWHSAQRVEQPATAPRRPRACSRHQPAGRYESGSLLASNFCGFGEARQRWLVQLKPDPLGGKETACPLHVA